MAAVMNSARDGFQIRGLRKRFGNTQALDGVNLDLPAGRITGIAGPNGAGKSTLIRILAGESSADEGTIDLDGSPWSPNGDQVAVVHQEPQLFPNLTVAQNLLVGRERTRAAWPSPTSNERALMRQLELTNQADRALGDCSLAVQQRTEIARAVGADARLFLFDEPNSALSPAESEDLFGILDQLARQGRVVVLVSHRLGELVANCSSVAIIRDGRVTSELAGDSLSAEQIAERLVAGHTATAASAASEPHAPAGPILSLTSWTQVNGAFRGIDMTLNAGQVAAVVGVEGSGAREFVRSIAGLERARGTRQFADPYGATSMSVAYVGPDRREALFYNLSVAENIGVRLDDDRVARFGMLRRAGVRDVGEVWISRFNIRTQSIDQPVGALSGGNQQKVVVAAAAATNPKILILEEPTRGVDVSSKKDIHDLLKEFARGGHGVLIFTTEVVEAFEAADELYVMVGGSLVGPLSVQDYRDVESLASRVTVLESRR
jgi:ABC-type sugar transport system ATPase subunit